MLDKTVPYYNIIMKRAEQTPVPKYNLYPGFSFVYYQVGNELDWAKIVTSVGEFDTIEEALDYFKTHYSPYLEQLQKRCIFIQNEKKELVATFTIWWNQKDGKNVPSLHWIAVKPEYQGLGLGKAVVFKGMEITIELEGDIDVYLHTQTWSYKAVGIYLQAGFKILPNEILEDYGNDFELAYPILQEKMNRKLEISLIKW